MAENPLQRRARERRRAARQQRAAQGTAAMDQARGRTAERSSGEQRIDYTPKIPNERPSTIIVGTTRAQDDAAKKKKKLPTIKHYKRSYNHLERSDPTKVN